jgi:hypothetical protein
MDGWPAQLSADNQNQAQKSNQPNKAKPKLA